MFIPGSHGRIIMDTVKAGKDMSGNGEGARASVFLVVNDHFGSKEANP